MHKSRLAALLLFATMPVCVSHGSEPPSGGQPAGHEFGAKIVMVRMRTGSPDGRFAEGYLEQARICRVGDTSFLVGVMHQDGLSDATCCSHPVTIWLPLADVAEIAEFKSWQDVENAWRNPSVTRPPMHHWMIGEDGVLSCSVRHGKFRIPFRLTEQDRQRIGKVILFCSRDGGKSWRQIAEATPNESEFTVSLTEGGLYWLATQTVGKGGEKHPASEGDFKPSRKIDFKPIATSTAK